MILALVAAVIKDRAKENGDIGVICVYGHCRVDSSQTLPLT